MAEQEVTEPEATEPEPQSELPEPAPVPLESSESVAPVPLEAPLEEESAPLDSSSEEEPPPPKRVRKARVQPAEPKAEPKRRGRPPGARNIVRAPAAVQQDPMEIIMTSMRERRQAHQERQHTFFQSFLPA